MGRGRTGSSLAVEGRRAARQGFCPRGRTCRPAWKRLLSSMQCSLLHRTHRLSRARRSLPSKTRRLRRAHRARQSKTRRLVTAHHAVLYFSSRAGIWWPDHPATGGLELVRGAAHPARGRLERVAAAPGWRPGGPRPSGMHIICRLGRREAGPTAARGPRDRSDPDKTEFIAPRADFFSSDEPVSPARGHYEPTWKASHPARGRLERVRHRQSPRSKRPHA